MDDVLESEQTPVITVVDDAALQEVVGELFASMFDMPLEVLPEGALAVETDVGALFVGVLSDFIIAMELRVNGRYLHTDELLVYLNEQNAGSAFITFSVVDERLWLSGHVDGNPLLPVHLARVVTYLFQAATALTADLMPDEA